MARESLYSKMPDYRVEFDPNAERVQVRFGGALIADSARRLLIRETNHVPVVYFPRADVAFEYLEGTSHETFCPFKGEASYWTIRVAARSAENAVWSYEEPFEQVAGLKDYLAFYPDKVEIAVVGADEAAR